MVFFGKLKINHQSHFVRFFWQVKLTPHQQACAKIAQMSHNQLGDPDFAKNAIQTAVIVWAQPAQFALPQPVSLPQEVTRVNELAVVPFRPSIASSPTIRDFGKSVLKRVVEIVAAFVPESYGGTYSGESSGEGSSSKKQKKN